MSSNWHLITKIIADQVNNIQIKKYYKILQFDFDPINKKQKVLSEN